MVKSNEKKRKIFGGPTGATIFFGALLICNVLPD